MLRNALWVYTDKRKRVGICHSLTEELGKSHEAFSAPPFDLCPFGSSNLGARLFQGSSFQSAPKERRRGRAEKRLSKRVFLESPFLLCSLKVFSTFQVF